MRTLVGFDPGRDKSYAALAVLERHAPPVVHPHELPPEDRRSLAEVAGPLPAARYTIRFLRRFPRELSHPQIIDAVVEAFTHPALPTPKVLLTDATSLGGHMALDWFRLARVQVQPVVWHGGLTTTLGDGEWHVGKVRALIMASATPFCFYTTQKYLAVKISRSSMA